MCKSLLYFIIGMVMFIFKSMRLIYILISFETMILGVFMSNTPLLSEMNFIGMLVFAVTSSVVGLLMMITMMTSYGQESVKF